MLNGKQRATLNKLAQSEPVVLIIGKGEITENIIKQAEDALTARELINCKVISNSGYTAREAAEEIAEAVNAEIVRVIGGRFVLYRENFDRRYYVDLL